MTPSEAVQLVGAIVVLGGLGDSFFALPRSKGGSVAFVLIGCATVVAGALLGVRP